MAERQEACIATTSSAPGLVAAPLASPLPEVSLWWIDLDQPLVPLARASLSDEERARARRFHFERDAHRFEVGRALVRQLLAAQLGCAPAGLVIQTLGQGKPVLAGSPRALHFNLSHSAGVGLVAITTVAPVGVDIERLRDMPDALALARDHFSAEELARLTALPAERRSRAFLRGWTRKEACLKAWGTGLGLSPRQVHTGLLPQPCTIAAPCDPCVGGALQLVSLTWPENEGHEAAVALGTAGGARHA